MVPTPGHFELSLKKFEHSSAADELYLLPGITSRLDYFNYLDIGTIWLSPIYESPMADFGYDVSNFTSIDPIFGTMEDFEDLLRSAHSKGSFDPTHK